VTFRLALAQVPSRVGDIDGNATLVLDAWRAAAGQGVDAVVFTELTITGYPPEDLLLKREFVEANLAALGRLATDGPSGTVAIVGFVGAGDDQQTDAGHWDVALATRNLTNSAAVLADGTIAAVYDKLRLPNYGVFDEARYFTPRDRPCVVSIAGVQVGVTVCEDLWSEAGPVQASADAGAQIVANLNASPYHRGKQTDREAWVRHHATRGGIHLAYCNAVGGQDEVVFDGDSMLGAPDGTIIARGAQFADELVVVDLDIAPATPAPGTIELPGAGTERPSLSAHVPPPRLDPVGEVWAALVLATRDYCHRNGFEDAVIGLSGGIDSAVVAALAVDALGGEHVTTVAMPSPYSSDHSVADADALADALRCRHLGLPIGGPLAAVSDVLGDEVVTGFDRDHGTDAQPGVAYENIQSRLRGLLLMALSNEQGSIVLTTGNKTEYAVGYATLYGDMSGGFAPIKDVAKLLVYELARWRNRDGEVIPTSTIEKPPSAELRPGQLDGDSLPDYATLDDIVRASVELDLGIDAIVERGHDRAEVRRVLTMIDRAEFKRRQAAPGPKVTERAFGRDRRVPITTGWRG